MKKSDVLLLGMDLVKPEEVLHAAYNDAKGVTEAFNKNILNTVNELIQSDFHPGDFEHLAFYNRVHSRMEMHLVARKEIRIQSPCSPREIRIGKNERIHTENSHKYERGHIRKILEATGLSLVQTHTDERRWFAITELVKG
jgi:L-histidine N-alpha-methyltransferase